MAKDGMLHKLSAEQLADLEYLALHFLAESSIDLTEKGLKSFPSEVEAVWGFVDWIRDDMLDDETTYKTINEIRIKDGLKPIEESHIIRCKDCKYSINYYNDGRCYCRYHNDVEYFGGDWNFYCSRAERKEQ